MKSPKFSPPEQPKRGSKGEHLGDGEVYLYWDPKVELAVNVALATQRPLLVRGDPGTGKSSLARNVSVVLERDFESVVVTSRTAVTDLLWELDLVDRLARAHIGDDVRGLAPFVRPRPFWRALTHWRPEHDAPVDGGPPDPGAVLLIDEIDKADPDLPNALLEPMASRSFAIPPLARTITCERPAPLVVFTTNGYRQLSRPFLRRCIEVVLQTPPAERLVEIACHHFGDDNLELYNVLARKVSRSSGSTAEYLDAVRACGQLGIGLDAPELEWLLDATIRKPAGARE
jgi:MoxR-like ATPase